MALFEVDEAATKIRNEVDENANIIFGSSICESLEGIIRVSVVATGINNEDEIQKNETFTNHNIKSTEIIFEDKSNDTLKVKEDILNLDEENIDNSDQIELESHINGVNNIEKIANGEKFEKNVSRKENNEKLGEIINKKPINHLTINKPENLLKRLSTFFKTEELEENKVEPNIKNISEKAEGLDNSKSIDNYKFEDEIKNDDLFKTEENRILSDQQINLIDIEQNEEKIDENILEIPAFLRRQAN